MHLPCSTSRSHQAQAPAFARARARVLVRDIRGAALLLPTPLLQHAPPLRQAAAGSSGIPTVGP